MLATDMTASGSPEEKLRYIKKNNFDLINRINHLNLLGHCRIMTSLTFYLNFMEFRWAFRMYDKDNSGSIELAEMIEIIGTLYEMEGVSKVFSFIQIQIK